MGASAAMAQAQPAEFMVFFDWGKPEVRGDDGATLDKVSEAWRSRPGARVSLAGHTDRSGDALANRRAGLARAATVRSELEKRGIPGNAIRIASFGEDRPLVPTEDGVREVQNRRVVISFEE
jgi:OOP family OmpA-OmpF porin